jgi:hypothetical protein
MSPISGVVPESPDSSISPDSGAVDFKAIREKIFGTRNKSPKVKKVSAAVDDAGISEKELAELFAGENWEEISSLYFDARYAITGFPGFRLEQEKKKVLGLTLGRSMKMLLKIDPGYIALLVFTTTLGGIVASKEIAYHHAVKELEKKNEPAK